MKYSLSLLKKFVDIKLKPDKLADLLTLSTAEVESFEKKGSDTIFEIKILPNRGDLLSHLGLAREISALTGAKLKKLESKKPAPGKSQKKIEISIESAEDAPRYSAIIVEGLKIKKSPADLAKTLNSLGIRPINNVVDSVNYVMLLTGQPLHAFDYQKISTNAEGRPELIVRGAKAGENIAILDESGTKYDLPRGALVISDVKNSLAIAGIKGGLSSAVSAKTESIVIEAANFDKKLIRKTSTSLNLRTDASIRFSYGLDPNLTMEAALLAAEMITKLSGGKIVFVADKYPRPLKPRLVVAKLDYIRSLLGENIDSKKIKSLLDQLGLQAKINAEMIEVTVPTYRSDLQTGEDIIEEVGRIYGYDKLSAKPPVLPAFDQSQSKQSDLWDFHEKRQTQILIQDILKSMAFTECYSYSFISEVTKEVFKLRDVPEILNPLSEDMKYLRPSLIPNLVLAGVNNLRFSKNIKLFEVGHVYKMLGSALEEYQQFAGVKIGPRQKNQIEFAEIKGIVESLLQQLGIDNAQFVSELSPDYTGRDWYHPGKVARVEVGDTIIGVFGELNPAIAVQLEIDDNLYCCMFSFNLDRIYQLVEGELEYEPIPKFPSIIRDISILVKKDVNFNRILSVIQGDEQRNKIVRNVDVFDIYEPDDDRLAGAGGNNRKKSVAFHVIYRADDRTLTDVEVNKIEEGIKEDLKTKLGAEIR